MGIEQGQEAVDSPSTDPPLPGDNGGSGAPETVVQPQSDPPADTSKGTNADPPPAADAPPKEGDTPAAADQLSEALDLLCKPEERKLKPKEGQPSSDKDEKPKDGKEQAKTEGAEQDDAFAGMTDEERKAISLKPKTEKRIKDLYGRARVAETKLAEMVKVKGNAEEITQHLKAANADAELGYVEPKQMVALTVAQAALNRVIISRQNGAAPSPRDIQTAKQFFAGVAGFAEAIGETIPSKVKEPEPFTGEVPKDLEDLDKVYGVLSEDETKAIAALRAAKAAEKSKPTKTDPPAPKKEEHPPKADPARIAAEVENRTWIEATLGVLNDDGIEPAKTQAYYEEKLLPRMKAYLEKQVPNVPSDTVMDRLNPKAKHQLVLLAHREEKAAASSPPARKPATAPANRNRPLTSTGTTSRVPAPSQSDDVQKSAIDYLARD